MVATLQRCNNMLSTPRPERVERHRPRRKLEILRRCSAKLWLSTYQDVRATARTISPTYRSNAYWEVLFKEWARLRDLLEVQKYTNYAAALTEMAQSTPMFGSLTRCHWRECLCNVHKPAHHLKVCKGCWRVAYCNPKCQAK